MSLTLLVAVFGILLLILFICEKRVKSIRLRILVVFFILIITSGISIYITRGICNIQNYYEQVYIKGILKEIREAIKNKKHEELRRVLEKAENEKFSYENIIFLYTKLKAMSENLECKSITPEACDNK